MNIQTARDWINQWDAGNTVTSIEMGGLGPEYEQAIQVTVVEILRELLTRDPGVDDDTFRDWWKSQENDFITSVFANLPPAASGLTGAQWGVACNLAFILYRRGPIAFEDDVVADRRIKISRNEGNNNE